MSEKFSSGTRTPQTNNTKTISFLKETIGANDACKEKTEFEQFDKVL